MKFSENEYVPMKYWGKDHWSLLAYINHVAIDCAGFQVGFDPRMSQNRHHYRVMMEQCPKPKRSNNAQHAECMWKPEYKSQLTDAEAPANHDDWCCVQDMAQEHFFEIKDSQLNQTAGFDAEGVEPGVILRFTAKGIFYTNALAKHYQEGGNLFGFSEVAKKLVFEP